MLGRSGFSPKPRLPNEEKDHNFFNVSQNKPLHRTFPEALQLLKNDTSPSSAKSSAANRSQLVQRGHFLALDKRTAFDLESEPLGSRTV
jgi:hypothetical protein